MNKAYVVSKKHNLGSIEEVELIKETEKTVVIKRNGWPRETRNHKVTDYECIVMSESLAIEKAKDILAEKARANKAKIKALEIENEKISSKEIVVEYLKNE